MDARLARATVLVAICLSLGASHRTQNFVVTAPTPEIAEQVGTAAEQFRLDLAKQWLGKSMRNWAQPCPISVQVGNMGAGGYTSFMFDQGDVYGWKMEIQGSLERVLDSVLPHEITHTIFATHFRQPLPRWADEGACTTVEHASERAKQQQMLISFLRNNRGIAFAEMFAMREYPQDVMPLYSQGHSLTAYLLDQGGRQKFLAYIGEGMQSNNWVTATQNHYGFTNLGELQNTWLDWVKQGSPLPVPETLSPLARRAAGNDRLLASAEPAGRATPQATSQSAPRSGGLAAESAAGGMIYRGQSPETHAGSIYSQPSAASQTIGNSALASNAVASNVVANNDVAEAAWEPSPRDVLERPAVDRVVPWPGESAETGALVDASPSEPTDSEPANSELATDAARSGRRAGVPILEWSRDEELVAVRPAAAPRVRHASAPAPVEAIAKDTRTRNPRRSVYDVRHAPSGNLMR